MAEAKSQRVMVLQEMTQGFFQQLRIKGHPGGQQDGLIKVMRISISMIKEPLLYGHQRKIAFDWFGLWLIHRSRMDDFGQRRNRLMLEQVDRRQVIASLSGP